MWKKFCVWNLAFQFKMQIQGTLFPTSLKTTVVSARTFLLFCLFANIVAFYFASSQTSASIMAWLMSRGGALAWVRFNEGMSCVGNLLPISTKGEVKLDFTVHYSTHTFINRIFESHPKDRTKCSRSQWLSIGEFYSTSLHEQNSNFYSQDSNRKKKHWSKKKVVHFSH